MFFFFHETIVYLKGNSKIKQKFFQENSYTNKKNVFFGPKIGGRLIHGIDLYTGKYGKSARGPFSKDPVTYRARKAILATLIRLSWKVALLMCSRYKERLNNCQVSKLKTRSYWKYKGIYVTRKVLRRSRNASLVTNYEGEKISNLFFLSQNKREMAFEKV